MRVDTWTVYIINTKIVKFNFLDSNSKKRWVWVDDYSSSYCMLITSDWTKTYKTRKFSAKELKLPKYSWKEPGFFNHRLKKLSYLRWDCCVCRF